MKIKNSKLKIIFVFPLFFVLCSLALYSTHDVNAQVNIPLTVAPARQELTIKPGEKSAVIVKFLNQGTEPVSGVLKVADFIVEDSEGSPTFIEGPNQISPRFAAASWVELPYDRITIAPKDKVLIQAKITAPADAQPGGRYIAIYFEPSGSLPEEATVSARQELTTPVAIRVAGLVSIRVAGPVEEKAYVQQLQAPRFLEYGPIDVTTEILNKGNYHIKPKGTVALYSPFGKKIDEQILKEQNIFPDATRIYQNKLGQKWLLGKYKIELNAAYGETGKVLTATVFTWIIPWKMIATIVLSVIIIILLLAVLFHRIRKREEELEEKVEELEEKLGKKSE
jgi:hypothetical protein